MRKHADENLDPPSSQLIEALEAHGYKAAAVERWTTTRAQAALAAAKKADAIAMRRSVEKAKAEGVKFEGAPAPRGFPLPMERLATARFLLEPMPADDLPGAIWSAAYQLDDSELKRLAGYLARILAADDGRCPDQLRYLAAQAGGDRGETVVRPEDAPAGVDPGQAPGPAGGMRQAGAGVRAVATRDPGLRGPSLPGL